MVPRSSRTTAGLLAAVLLGGGVALTGVGPGGDARADAVVRVEPTAPAATPTAPAPGQPAVPGVPDVADPTVEEDQPVTDDQPVTGADPVPAEPPGTGEPDSADAPAGQPAADPDASARRPSEQEPPAAEPAPGSLPAGPDVQAGAVPLVVGLKPGANRQAPVNRLDARPGIDVVDTDPVPGINAVTVDVPATDQADAAAALRQDPAVAYVEINHRRRVSDVAVNDPYRSWQWGLDRVRLPAAWDTTVGSTSVTVAVLDTGVSAVSELTGALVGGHDFVNNDNNPTDDEGHGTSVATLIGAGGNENTGIAGVCWLCRIMPVKVLDHQGEGRNSTVAAGIVWAADHGANVINMSLGGPEYSVVIRDAVRYAVAKGIVVVAAAGNSGTYLREYPAAYPDVLSVAGTTRWDTFYPWSNFGQEWVDLAAPGCNAVQASNGAMEEDFCGTSSAAPVVAGIAALARAASPGASVEAISTALTSTAAPVQAGFVSGGRVDAAAALAALPGAAKVGPTIRLTRPGFWTHLRDWVNVGAILPGNTAKLELVVDGAPVATDTTAPWDIWWYNGGRNGNLNIAAVATDAGGHQSTVWVPVIADNSPPTVSFRSPANQARLRGTVNVAADAGDNIGVDHVELLVDGRVVATDHAAPWSMSWASGRTSAWVRLSLRVFDKSGNAASTSRTVLVDNTPPAVRIAKGPKNKAWVAGTVKLTVAASDRIGVARVELVVNGKVVARDARAPYTFSIKTGRYGRKLTVRVRAYDHAGNVRYAPTRTWRR